MYHPFDYDLHLFYLPGKGKRTMICFHGYGDNYLIAESLKQTYKLESTLVSFNFPEYDIKEGREYNPKTSSFGSIEELLPALYVMKRVIIDQGLESVDFYGYSAGGGALINVIAVLNGMRFNEELESIGIGYKEKQKMLLVLQKGVVILDAPLKSIEEIIDLRGFSEEFEILAEKYSSHNLRPIDSLKMLKGLSLNVIIYFDEKDEVLSNRDDPLFIDRLQNSLSHKKATVIIGNEGGHISPHFSIWPVYQNKVKEL